MANVEKKMPVHTDDEKTNQQPMVTDPWRPLDKLRQQVDHLFEDFNRGSGLMPFRRGLFDIEPLWSREFIGRSLPAVDITEKDESFEITAELPGMDQDNIDIKLSNGNLIIKGEKKEDKEEKERVITCQSDTMAPSSGHSACPKAWMPTRSKPTSAKAC